MATSPIGNVPSFQIARAAIRASMRPPDEQVAEEPEGQGDRLGHLLDPVDEGLTGNRTCGKGWAK